MSVLEVKNLSHIYSQGTPFEKVAIDNINLKIEKGEFIGLVGHTGSGKSTFIQHLNGLLKPTSGEVYVQGKSISGARMNLVEVRQKVGLVFQYPEHQLFEETVEKDIAFGPMNLGLTNDEIELRVKDAMRSVGLSYEEYKDSSPFELSGGQKRRVAIAGVLALEPEILILDEIVNIYKEREITIVLVSHNMEDVAKYTSRMVVMSAGRVVMDGSPRELFSKEEELKSYGLAVPQIRSLLNQLKDKGLNVNVDAITVDEAFVNIKEYLRERENA